MPHFVIDCSDDVLTIQTEEFVIEQVHVTAHASGLFEENDIKVRVRPFSKYAVGNRKTSFIHVFADIMEGRTTEQKAQLSNAVVRRLTSLFPDVAYIAMNVRDFEQATYCNRGMVD